MGFNLTSNMLMLAAALVTAAAAAAAAPVVRVEPYGADAFRVRIAPAGGEIFDGAITALLPLAGGSREPSTSASAASAAPGSQTNGNLRVETAADGRRRFVRVSDGKLLLEEQGVAFGPPLDGSHTLPSANVSFGLGAAELFGLGQHRQACYESGGSQTPPLGRVFSPAGGVVHFDLARGEGGASNTLPQLQGATVGEGAHFVFWMNNPAMGTIDFDSRQPASRSMNWSLASVQQLDYLVATTSGSTDDGGGGRGAFELIERFTGWLGRSPGLPEWALGYWHSKNRYASQAELLAAAHGFANRSIPVSYMIIDWMHWKVQGDWSFDPQYWPDPSAMVAEIKGLGMEVMVTVWPFSHNGSKSYDTMVSKGWLTETINHSRPEPETCPENNLCPPGIVTLPDGLHGCLVDVTKPAAMDYVWSMLEKGYYDHGIKAFWLDASEPEYYEFPQWGQVHWKNAKWGNGTMQAGSSAVGGTVAELGQYFALGWTEALQAGLRSKGESSSVMLPRGGYGGSWRTGAALWSGDIWCTFKSLQSQLRTGVSAQTSGFGLWTSDIGGFAADPDKFGGGCNPSNSSYAELVVRWFQFGVTNPIFRQHGSRDTEVWKYGPRAEAMLASIIRWRAQPTIKAYLQRELAKMSATGRPLNRWLWWDFADDVKAWAVDDQYMFGDDYMAAPVMELGATERSVYFPGNPTKTLWTHAFTNDTYISGQVHTVTAPLGAAFPLFKVQHL